MRLIDADDFGNRMDHEAFEKDTDMLRWDDSGCWIRYKLFEKVLREQPTVEPEQCEWIAKEVKNVPYGLLVECSKCGGSELVNNALYHKYCPNCGRKVITE